MSASSTAKIVNIMNEGIRSMLPSQYSLQMDQYQVYFFLNYASAAAHFLFLLLLFH